MSYDARDFDPRETDLLERDDDARNAELDARNFDLKPERENHQDAMQQAAVAYAAGRGMDLDRVANALNEARTAADKMSSSGTGSRSR